MRGVRGRCIMAEKVPGGLWMALLFVPWIVYWVLCGLGHASGMLVGLALSAAIYAISPDKKSIMALTTLC